jgi:hypothetical protein
MSGKVGKDKWQQRTIQSSVREKLVVKNGNLSRI